MSNNTPRNPFELTVLDSAIIDLIVSVEMNGLSKDDPAIYGMAKKVAVNRGVEAHDIMMGFIDYYKSVYKKR